MLEIHIKKLSKEKIYLENNYQKSLKKYLGSTLCFFIICNFLFISCSTLSENI